MKRILTGVFVILISLSPSTFGQISTAHRGDMKLVGFKHGPMLSVTRTASQTNLGISVGDRFPNFTFKNAQGREMSIDDLRGDIVVVHFFATWCPPCKSELYVLNDVYEALVDEMGIMFVTLNFRDSFGRCSQYARQVGYTIPIYDSGQQSRTAYLGDGISRRLAVPTSFILDSDGIVLVSKFGTMEWDKLEEPLRDAARSVAGKKRNSDTAGNGIGAMKRL